MYSFCLEWGVSIRPTPPRMRLELPTLREARGFVRREQAILDVLGDGVDGSFILFVGAGWVETKGGVVGVDKVVFHRNRDRMLDLQMLVRTRGA